MTWKGLDILRNALGDVGEGVTSYLAGRREDARREQNYNQVKAYLDTPEGQKLDRSMVTLAFPTSGYDAMKTIGMFKPQTQILQGQYPGQYKVASTPGMGGQTTISNPAGQSDAMNPEDVPYDLSTGLPKGMNSADELDGYITNMQRLKKQVDDYNASDAGKTTPRSFHPKLQAGLDVAMATRAAITKSQADKMAAQLQNAKDLASFKVKELDPIKQQAELEVYAKKLGLKSKMDLANIDPLMLEREARKYAITGEMPAMGMGNGPLRTAIMTRGAQIAQAEGETDPEVRKGLFTAHQHAYSNLLSQWTSIGAREKTAKKNLDLALEVSKQFPRSSYPILNKFRNWYAENIDNNPKYTALENAIFTGAREYAKVAGGNIGNTPLSDQQIKEIEKLLNPRQTPEQLAEAVDIMHRDMANVESGFQDQLQIARQMMTGFGGGSNTGGGGNAKDPMGILN